MAHTKKKAKKKVAKKKSMLGPHPKGKPRVNKKKVAGSMLTLAGVVGMGAAGSLVASGAAALAAGVGNSMTGKGKIKPKRNKVGAKSKARKSRAAKGSSIGPSKKKKKGKK